ncbi:Serine/threonine protein kinase [Parasponia andersonii]|uniref:Serine/threonine protein kinase n=1 Tax=Parasponia andersonii TaxID=3476 RepID=A0A2P5CDQ0_PARAD|nr:Serine/threonine protein kinase [Parasponia andersonii]
MEIAARVPKPPPPNPKFFNSRASVFVSNFVPVHKISILKLQIQGLKTRPRQFKNLGVVCSNSESQTPSTVVADRWLLQPVGDGDSRHIGFKVELPNAFEIASDEVTVGRLPDKADLVIPVATVSARHARIQKKEGNLLVTDLDSTNGTFIDDKRLSPGVVASVSPGSCITFGDTHLAIFRVSKLERVESASTVEGPEAETDTPAEST